MPRFRLSPLLVIVLSIVGADTLALDLVAGTGINFKRLDMSLEQDIHAAPTVGSNAQLRGDITQDIAFDAWQPFVQGSLAALQGDWYGVINAEIAALDEGSDVDVEQTRAPGLAISISPAYTDGSVDVGRQDLGVTLGWRGLEATALFAGFKYGKTDFDGDEARREFVADGPFVGASYAWPLTASTLSAGAAWAWMSGKYSENGSGPLLARDSDGDASGLSLFVNWSVPLSARLRYAIDLRWQRYDFDGSDHDICNNCNSPAVEDQPVQLDRDFEVRETVYSAGVGLTYAL